MSITLWLASHRRSGVRLWGAILGLVPGALLTLPSISAEPMTIGRAIAMAAVPIGGTLGSLFAPAAVQPGARSAVRVATGVALIAVVVGSFVTSALIAQAGDDPSGDSSSTLNVAVFGLLFLGLPMFVVIMPIALMWVGAIRLVARRLGGAPQR